MNPKTLILATHNKGKLAEVKAMLEPLGFEVVSAEDLDLEDVEETGADFAQNAALKAHHAAQKTQKLALADDSGLCVEALDGAPGLYSARWCGAQRSAQTGIARVQEELEKVKDKKDNRAKLVCTMALAWPDGRTEVFEGSCAGTLVFPPRQVEDYGYGFDPIFQPEGLSKTFGEMPREDKAAFSHRAMALKKVIAFLEGA
ncbi:MAG: RdgB/HAM1 family non-canonical purine NTP pyrophosphatase [Alphaproteobacteria bacterium]|nr:RdgB/HAM1 family non-canonical purine NTP pyrophosphatase [Alphaproteobacteria bacterium]